MYQKREDFEAKLILFVLSVMFYFKIVKTSFMFFDISTVTVFFARLLEGHNFVFKAI